MLVRALDALGRLTVGELAGVLAPQSSHHAGHDHGEPVRPGVDHPRLLEHRELVGPALHRLVARVECSLEHLRDQLVLLGRRGLGAQARGIEVR